MSNRMVIIPMEEYNDLLDKAEKLRSIKRLAKDILVEHTEDNSDWCKPSDMTVPLNIEESQTLLKPILD